MNIETDLQKYIDDFRFQIVDDNDVQRSSTWRIWENNGSVYVAARTLAGKMKLSFHQIGVVGRDGKSDDSQYGLVTSHRDKLKAQGYTVPDRIRWKRPNNREKIKRGASILFPTDYMTGEVYQFVKEKKRKVSLPLAPVGHAVEVSIFFHYLGAEIVEKILMKHGYTPIFYMTMHDDEFASVAARQSPFDKNILPKSGTYTGSRLGDIKIEDSKFLHAIWTSDPKDGEPILLCEVNGFEVKNELPVQQTAYLFL